MCFDGCGGPCGSPFEPPFIDGMDGSTGGITIVQNTGPRFGIGGRFGRCGPDFCGRGRFGFRNMRHDFCCPPPWC